MIHIIGIGPGDSELLTLKAARLLREADIIYVPQSNNESRSVANDIIAPHVGSGELRYVVISMRSPRRGADPVYGELAKEMAEEARRGRNIVYVSMGDILLYSTGQYLGRELSALGAKYAYTPGIPAFIAAASVAGLPLAADKEGLLVQAMPDTLEDVAELTQRAATVVLMKVNKRLPVLLDYVRRHVPAQATLLHRVGLEGECCFDLTAEPELPENIGYLSIAIVRRK